MATPRVPADHVPVAALAPEASVDPVPVVALAVLPEVVPVALPGARAASAARLVGAVDVVVAIRTSSSHST